MFVKEINECFSYTSDPLSVVKHGIFQGRVEGTVSNVNRIQVETRNDAHACYLLA